MRLVLPYWPRRAGIAAFGVVIGLWVAALVAIMAPLRPAPRAATALLCAVVVATAFRMWPREGEILYQLWVRASRLYARVAQRIVLIFCHAVVSVAGLAGTSLMLARPAADRSLWQTRHALDPAAYASQFEARGTAWAGRPWRAVVDWAGRSGNGWVVCVLPFLVFVSMLDTEEQGRYPAGIYTLF